MVGNVGIKYWLEVLKLAALKEVTDVYEGLEHGVGLRDPNTILCRKHVEQHIQDVLEHITMVNNHPSPLVH